MTGELEIRDGGADDVAAIFRLYATAFPEEDLRPLIQALLDCPARVVSLVAVRARALAGHVMLTECELAGHGRRLALLGPLAVAPDAQRQGVGGALVGAGLQRLIARGVHRVLVLGDPAYYARFGFAREEAIRPPYPLPDQWRDAWQSRRIAGSGSERLAGDLEVPEPWRQAELWAATQP